MTPPRTVRRTLPLLSTHRDGSRQAATCHWKCGNACSQPVPNTSTNDYFGDVVGASRRSVLKTGGAAAALVGVSGAMAAGTAAPAAAAGAGARKAPFGFEPITPVPAATDEVVVPDGFQWAPIIAWGDPVLAGAPAFDFENQTAAAQAGQMGYNNDYVGVLRNGSTNAAVLVTNNEYTNNNLMFHGYSSPDAMTDEQVRITLMAHGMTVVELTRRDPNSRWSYTKGAPLNRRITAETPFAITGAARGHELMRTSADPKGEIALGTIGNCAGGTTPWGTVLSGEENFNSYFTQPDGAGDDLVGRGAERYGLAGGSSAQHDWDRFDRRWDLTREPNEAHRFGWIVEVNPFDPTSTPRKLTALGRFKHEGANVTINADGKCVAYMGDDERFDYMYKFVSKGTYVEGDLENNMRLLEEGDLYVAKFVGDGTADGEHDGTGRWLPLVVDGESKVEGMSVAEVLVFTRLAADAVGPTKMDRPEDVEVNPVNGRVYVALTNNSQRGSTFPVDEANPVASSMVRSSLDAPLTRASGNRNGYVLEMTPGHGGHAGRTFTWDLMLVCGDPHAPETWFAGFPKQLVSPISCPDNVAFDAVGNLWVSTDGNALGSNDGLFRVPVDGPSRGHVQQFLTVPLGAETCGPLVTDDQQAVLVAVQHPGEVDGASFESPASTWPHTHAWPRPGVVVVRRS